MSDRTASGGRDTCGMSVDRANAADPAGVPSWELLDAVMEQGFTLEKHLTDLSRFLIQIHAMEGKRARAQSSEGFI